MKLFQDDRALGSRCPRYQMGRSGRRRRGQLFIRRREGHRHSPSLVQMPNWKRLAPAADSEPDICFLDTAMAAIGACGVADRSRRAAQWRWRPRTATSPRVDHLWNAVGRSRAAGAKLAQLARRFHHRDEGKSARWAHWLWGDLLAMPAGASFLGRELAALLAVTADWTGPADALLSARPPSRGLNRPKDPRLTFCRSSRARSSPLVICRDPFVFRLPARRQRLAGSAASACRELGLAEPRPRERRKTAPVPTILEPVVYA
jgi:hypothetical protein